MDKEECQATIGTKMRCRQDLLCGSTNVDCGIKKLEMALGIAHCNPCNTS